MLGVKRSHKSAWMPSTPCHSAPVKTLQYTIQHCWMPVNPAFSLCSTRQLCCRHWYKLSFQQCCSLKEFQFNGFIIFSLQELRACMLLLVTQSSGHTVNSLQQGVTNLFKQCYKCTWIAYHFNVSFNTHKIFNIDMLKVAKVQSISYNTSADFRLQFVRSNLQTSNEIIKNKWHKHPFDKLFIMIY